MNTFRAWLEWCRTDKPGPTWDERHPALGAFLGILAMVGAGAVFLILLTVTGGES